MFTFITYSSLQVARSRHLQNITRRPRRLERNRSRGFKLANQTSQYIVWKLPRYLLYVTLRWYKLKNESVATKSKQHEYTNIICWPTTRCCYLGLMFVPG
jgi:hypothetical protein